MKTGHQTVLLEEAVSALKLQPDSRVVDGTYGAGGHSRAILRLLSGQGRLLVLDRDPEACRQALKSFADDSRVVVRHASFAHLGSVIRELNWPSVHAVLLDLGVSSRQLEDAERGFSFQRDGPLDMRLNRHEGTSIREWLARASVDEIATVLKVYGEEPAAHRIARALVARRSQTPITTTLQLADLVSSVVARPSSNKHPATRVFLALRIKANDELEHLRQGLDEALTSLASSGRLVVISFHSLEDRIVKNFFSAAAAGQQLPRSIPLNEQELANYREGHILGPKIQPDRREVARNRRARSAILRVLEKAA